MRKKVDPEVRARAVRLIADHLREYRSLTAASAAVAKQVGVGHESVRTWRSCARRRLSLATGTRPPQPLMAGFIDTMRAEGYAAWSICRVLGCCVSMATGSPHEPIGNAGVPTRRPGLSPTLRSSTRSDRRCGQQILTVGRR